MSSRRAVNANNQKNHRKIFPAVILLVFLAVFFVKVNYAAADVGDAVATVLGWIAAGISLLLGLILSLLIKVLINIASFNRIIDVPTVVNGWVVIRDLCNMFFILILLVIAFATILRIESYNYKKLLPKLLIMAVLINFSRTIFGLLIDFSQVIMLTFVNSFTEFGAGQFIDMFNTRQVLAMAGKTEPSGWAVSVGIIAGVIALIITVIVMAVMVAVLVVRIVMLWIYTIFSPLVFLGFAFPPVQKYTGRIWEDFSKQLVIGPVLAFFIWLALTTVKSSSSRLGQMFSGAKELAVETSAKGAEICAGLNALFCEGNFQTFIITIGLLMGGLMVAQQVGGAAGSIAGKGLDWAKRVAASPFRPLPGQERGLIPGVGNWLGRKFASFKGIPLGKVDEATGKRKKILRGFEVRPTKIYTGIKEALKTKAEREDRDVQAKAGAEMQRGRLLGALGASRDFTEGAARGFLWNRAWRTSEKGAIYSTYRVGKANKKVEKLKQEKEIAMKELNTIPKNKENKVKRKEKMEEVKKIESNIKEQEEVLKKYKAPYPFLADEKRMENIHEQAKKLGDNDNEDDLVDKFMDAIKQGNKELASAIFLHAAKVGHSNEVLEMVEVLKDVKNSKGVVVSSAAKKDKFRADSTGLNAMVNQYFKGKLGMSDQEAHSIQNQFSTLAQKANHYNLAQSIGSRNGVLYQRDEATQMKRTVNEMMKQDIEQLLRRLNRLGHGGEIPYEINGQEKRVADFNQHSLETFFKTAATWKQEVEERQRLNPKEALDLYNTFKIEQEIKGAEIGLAPNTALKAAITGPFTSILTAIENSGSADKTFFDKGGDEHTYRELALKSLKYGKTKYEAATFSDLNGNLATARLEKNKKEEKKLLEEIEKEQEISEAIGKLIENKLNSIPGYQEAEKKRLEEAKKKSKKKEREADEEFVD